MKCELRNPAHSDGGPRRRVNKINLSVVDMKKKHNLWTGGGTTAVAVAATLLVLAAEAVAAAAAAGGGMAKAAANLQDAVLDVSSTDAILSRHRRFSATNGVKLTVRFSLLLPLEGGSTLGIRIPFTYDVDTNDITSGKRRRDFDETAAPFHSQEEDRYKLIHQFEEYLGRFTGVDGHACMLRTLCEMAMVPEHEGGVMGDIFGLVMTPVHVVDKMSNFLNPNEYIRAQKDGRVFEDCSAYHHRCPHSFFELVDVAEEHHSNHSDDEPVPYVADPLFPGSTNDEYEYAENGQI